MTIPRASFEDLVRRHASAVFRTAARLLPAADAEDVTQMVFARVWEGKVAVGPEPAPGLCWLAGRLALNHLRGSRNRRRHEEAHAMATTADRNTQAALSPDEHLALDTALGSLPPDLHAAVVLRFHEDMTFQGIAHVLACAESTAHERVQRGLDRLRQLLTRAGFAAVGLRLDAVLPRVAAVSPTPTSALQAQLLALPDTAVAGAATAKTSAGAWVFASGMIGALLVGATAFFGRTPTPSPAPSIAVSAVPTTATGERAAPEASVRVALPATATEPASAAPSLGDEPQGHIIGNVFDASTGQPLVDCTVNASSWARGQKGRPFVIKAKTDATGRYALDLPVSERRKEAYGVWVSLPDYVHYSAGTLMVVADQTLALRIPLRRWAIDTPGEWTMEVAVTDPLGQPVQGALVLVQRRRNDPGEGHAKEANATTDASGRATLRGTHHGEKIVRVSLPKSDLANAWRELSLTTSGPHTLEVRLERGVALAGTLRAAADGAPLPKVYLRATQDDEEAGWAQTDAEGRFSFGGLNTRPTEVFLQAEGWSPFCARGLMPGSEAIELAAKAAIDPTPRGLFEGELHGTATDAATREPVSLSIWDVDADWLRPAVADWRADVLDEVLNPRPVQRAVSGKPRDPAPDFHVTSLREGRYALIVRQRGYAPAIAGPFEVGPGRLHAGIDVRLQRGGTVIGSVRETGGGLLRDALFWVTAASDPLAEARSAAASLEGGDRYAGYRYHRKPDTEGRFSIEHLPSGIALRAVAAHATAGVAVSAPFVLEEDGRQAIELRLSR